MKKIIVLLSLILIFSSASALAIYFWPAPNDSLCEFAKERGMSCLTMAAPTVFERGAVLTSVQPDAATDPLISLPDEYLFSDACMFPGSSVEFSKFHDDPSKRVSLPNTTISIDRGMSAASDVSEKSLGGIKFSGGPRATSSMNIEMTSEGASFFNIEMTPFRDALESCQIRKSCVARLSAGNTRVVKQLLVAKKLALKVSDERGLSFPLKLAMNNGLINADVNGKTAYKAVETLPDQGDVAFGAKLFEPSDLQNIKECGTDLVVLGSTTTSVFKATVQPRNDVLSGAPPIEPLSQELRDGDQTAKVYYTAPDRGPYEGMFPAESWSSAKAMVDPVGLTAEFVHLFTTNPGARWDNKDGSGIPEFPTAYASAKASAESFVTIKLGNRSDFSKMLRMTVKSDYQQSISLLGKILQRYEYFSPIELVRSSGTKVSINAVWQDASEPKGFDIGMLAPGEVVTVELTYKSGRDAQSEQDGGTLRKRVLSSFHLE